MNPTLEEMLASSTTSFALYHLPGAKDVVCLQDSHPQRISGIAELMDGAGYVVAPFCEDEDLPILLLHPERLVRMSMDALICDAEKVPTPLRYTHDDEVQQALYHESFCHVASALAGGRARKVVLARQMHLHFSEVSPLPSLMSLFATACRIYPDNFVSLWRTPQTGCWLVATPECLLEKVTDTLWHTMALAGTMTWPEGAPHDGHAHWSRKNREEQKCVRDYIHDCILPHARHIEVSPTYPARAGQLAHLRTDFTFSLHDEAKVGQLIAQLHPTPAVCGMPTAEAAGIIAEAEKQSRRYYSGYNGPWHLEGECRLYVSLRCMEWRPEQRHSILYIGGGVMPTSLEENEWNETVRKAGTMLRVIGHWPCE